MKIKCISSVLFGCVFICHACGDMFAARTRIIGHYYLFEEDASSDFSIRYKLSSGDFIG
ncbi:MULTISPECIES: hypothetical protein [Niastella]|uniref:C2H2-type domain-containing protein n=1 Tax=Niastella soli TaxID=2821487 RepID=A0ABS3Z0Y7_9BACT|nr:hypothetical protein [Niastella soli]MBO9203836.1 hypothetical protein [Niastella soli]